MATQTGSIDLKAAKDAHDEASKKATNYISSDSSGIMVYDGSGGPQTPSNPSSTTNNVFIDDDSLDIRKGTDVLASFGTSVIIGQNANGYSRTEIGASGMQIFRNNGSDVQIAQLGYGQGHDSSGQLVNTPFYTLGRRKSDSAIGVYSVAEGNGVEASGAYSHAEGYGAEATGQISHAESRGIADGEEAHAENVGRANSFRSHAEGFGIADNEYAHAEGYQTHANAKYSHASGLYVSTTRTNEATTAIGKYNSPQSDSAFEIGNGTDANNKSNAFRVDWSGNVEASGDIEDGAGNVLANKANASSLATVATTGAYSDLSGKPNLAAVATTGDYDDLTDKPQINSVSLAGNKSFADLGLIDFFHPVGSYYETSDPLFDPNDTWGGTWYLEAEGIVHVSAGSNYVLDARFTDIINADGTVGQKQGGEESVTLDTTQIPAHTHGSKTLTGTFRAYQYKTWNSNTTGIVSQAANGNNNTPPSNGTNNGGTTFTITATHEHSSVGGGQAHNNMQPHIPVNRWHRVA